jgi:hypothetical protein
MPSQAAGQLGALNGAVSGATGMLHQAIQQGKAPPSGQGGFPPRQGAGPPQPPAKPPMTPPPGRMA